MSCCIHEGERLPCERCKLCMAELLAEIAYDVVAYRKRCEQSKHGRKAAGIARARHAGRSPTYALPTSGAFRGRAL